ncbi:hypothetical protein SAMN02745163_02690 [Clostridium cavendishii DSM 21758]|uniref:Uncharacterized protein n=1 Tax=Clostridium cavendishii DSM 21758 TaxID=1121302 RepID=A0A1M6MMB9_9CLOT|nr:hypothetical protein SAMN02745163_02690 [Clostridium cavendishii DSM 21758]
MFIEKITNMYIPKRLIILMTLNFIEAIIISKLDNIIFYMWKEIQVFIIVFLVNSFTLCYDKVIKLC